MNITKTLTEEVAEKLVAPIRKKIDSIDKEIMDIANEAILETLPIDLKACFNKYGSLFIKANRAKLCNSSQELRVEGLPHSLLMTVGIRA